MAGNAVGSKGPAEDPIRKAHRDVIYVRLFSLSVRKTVKQATENRSGQIHEAESNNIDSQGVGCLWWIFSILFRTL